MVGMLQILTYLFAFYLVIKGFEILQISLASSRKSRTAMIAWSLLLLILCIGGAVGAVYLQEVHVMSINEGASLSP